MGYCIVSCNNHFVTKKIYGVITADIVQSRDITEFRKQRDRKLDPISKEHLRQGLILSHYAVTAWDEFEAILTEPGNIPQVILDLRRYFHPMELRIAIGIGEVSEPRRKPVNVFSGGEAFERAREAADHMKGGKGTKIRLLTRFSSGEEFFDRIANTMYNLHDTLMQSVTVRQWETINAQINASNQAKKLRKKRDAEIVTQEKIARTLGRHPSTVSRNLERGFYWQMQETMVVMAEIIGYYFNQNT